MDENTAQDLVARLAAIPYTGAISDILDEIGLTNQVLPKEIQSIHPGQTLAGRALTLLGGLTASTDPDIIFRPFLKMLGELRPGDLLVTRPMTVGQPIWVNFPVRPPSIVEPGARSLTVECVMSITLSNLGFPFLPDTRPRATSTVVGTWLITTCPS